MLSAGRTLVLLQEQSCASVCLCITWQLAGVAHDLEPAVVAAVQRGVRIVRGSIAGGSGVTARGARSHISLE